MNASIYRRASTNEAKQVNSLEIQSTVIANFCKRHGYTVADDASFVEYASGKDDCRVEFNRALDYAIKNEVVLICVSIDRLSRSLSVFSRIQEHIGRLRFCNLGDTAPNTVIIACLLALSQSERETISIRTKMAYESLKQANPNHPWGSPTILTTARPLGLKVRKDNARKFNSRIQSICADLEKADYLTLEAKAVRLNELGQTTRRGAEFNLHNLGRILRYRETAV